MNSLDPKAKRLRVADRSLQQARNALQGVLIALQDLPRQRNSPLTEALEATQSALQSIETAAEKIDHSRLESE